MFDEAWFPFAFLAFLLLISWPVSLAGRWLARRLKLDAESTRPIELRDRVVHPQTGVTGTVVSIEKSRFVYDDREETAHTVKVKCGPKLGIVTFDYKDLEHYR